MFQTKTGWVAQAHEDNGYRVDGERPTGVYVYNGFVRVALHHSGLEKADPGKLTIAGDPALLRELADCLIKVAEDIEDRRGF